ncbi:YciI family protein [Faecalispora anaeroviscerum]|uniref:YciI family protein n=1 Tax=Faecalispora anaeroviscerum TaxID=2991836 RepID=UPI0024BACD73|nr:YciI family protein [Faecalispora anaeroviscerum]
MFIANLTYLKPLSEVEKYLEAHIAYLDRYYHAGKFICSGRKNPRVGGVILFNAKDEAEMKEIISEDPFHVNAIASYEIIEFYPTKYAPDFQCFADQ